MFAEPKHKRMKNEQNHSEYGSFENRISKFTTCKEPPFAPAKHFEIYHKSSINKRRQFIRDGAREDDYDKIDEIVRLRYAHYNAEEKICHDRQLSTRLEIFPLNGDVDVTRWWPVLGRRALLSQGRVESSEKISSVGHMVTDMILSKYLPEVNDSYRIKLMDNLTFNNKDVIPVYSEVPDELLESLDVPDSLLFNYIDVNFVNTCTEKKLSKAVKMSQEEQNMIRCDCCGTGLIRCFENEDCPCYQLNKEMQSFQSAPMGTLKTVFSAGEPILFHGSEEAYGMHCTFACSELCACNGNCTNNCSMIIDKKVFPIEVFRNNKEMGFSLRSTVLIPSGTPVLEFVGEIVGTTLNSAHIDYSFQISYEEDHKLRSLVDKMSFTKNYKQLLKNLYQDSYYIDPKSYGNVGRMACHSCAPNLEVVRLFQKSLSPAHIRFIMISMKDIYPGTPLTVDYGESYVKNQLRGKCNCGTIVCPNGQDAEIFTQVTLEELKTSHIWLDNKQFTQWEENIYGPVWIERNKATETTVELPDIVIID